MLLGLQQVSKFRQLELIKNEKGQNGKFKIGFEKSNTEE
jgi:hypothetical protein